MCRVEGMFVVLGFLLGMKRLLSTVVVSANDQMLMVLKTFEGPNKLGSLYVGLGGVCVVNIVNDGEQVVIVVHGDGNKYVNIIRDNPIIVRVLLAHQITSLHLLPW